MKRIMSLFYSNPELFVALIISAVVIVYAWIKVR